MRVRVSGVEDGEHLVAPGQPRRDIFVASSRDGGTTWPPAATRLDRDAPGNAESHFPHIAAFGSSAWVIWAEFRNPDADVYMNRTTDDGVTWLAQDVRIDNGPPGTTTGVTQIAAGPTGVYATFQDDRTGAIGLYMNRSVDGGATWLPQDLVLRTVPGALTRELQDVVVDGTSVYVAWDDPRNGDWDVYFNIPFGLQAYGASNAGSGGIAPITTATGQPVLGGNVTLRVDQGLGGAPGALLIGGPGSQVAFPIFGGTLSVLPLVSLPFALGGAAGSPGAGSFALPIPIGDDPVLLGFAVYLQPVLFDPGAAAGLALANAIEMWIG